LQQVCPWQVDAPPSPFGCKQWYQDEQREAGSGLRQDQWIDRMLRFPCESEFRGEDGPSEDCGDAPKKCGCADKNISAQRMNSIGIWGVQDSGTEPESGRPGLRWRCQA